MPHPLSKRSRSRGVIAVELALVAIPLVLMSLAAIEFARAMYTYNTLAKLTRDGARFLSGFDPTVAGEYPTGIAINRMLYGQDTAGTEVLVPGLRADMIRICDRVNPGGCPGLTFANVSTGAGTGSVNLVRVAIDGYVFTPVFPGAGLWGGITFDTIGTTMRQVL